MKTARAAFTLIEMMISITILSIVMLFLYKSYASLNFSNNILKDDVAIITKFQKLKTVLYLDFSLALHDTIKIQNREKNEDVVFMQSSNSIHKRYNPYITYRLKENKLYRLESLKEFSSYELDPDAEFDVDYLGEVENFRVYKSSDKENNKDKEVYLIDIDFKQSDRVLLKVNVLNEL